MKLNRHNYEEYFILYMDNELGSEDRREVEFFVEQNPDLKAELDMVLQAKLSPDTDIHFDNKELLMVRNSAAISLTNYEEWLLSYIDNELTEEETRDVEQFVSNNPAIAAELRLLQQTKLQPEAIVFPDKQSLYRREEKARVIGIGWRRIAVAASLLIAISTTAIVLINNKPVKPDSGVASKNLTKDTSSKENNTAKAPVKQEQPVRNEVEQVETPKEENRSNSIANSKKAAPSKKEAMQSVPEPEDVVYTPSRGSNNLTTPDVNPNAYTEIKTDLIAYEGAPKENLTPTVVTVPSRETSDPTIESGNKGVRGFFRKVTRTIEKRTNINPTNDDNRLLVAGLAINMN